jgi:putative phage-type endonuclease
MSLQHFLALADEIEKKVGVNPVKADQGSDDWRRLKLGVISASNADCVLAGRTTQKRATYLAELVAQVATGMPPEFNAKALDWGKDNEQAARSAYEFHAGVEVLQAGMIFKDASMRAGCSLDGLVTRKRLVEIKCPYTSKVHIETVCAGKIDIDYLKQCQFQMWVTGAEVVDFVSYDPRMKRSMFFCKPIERDEDMQKLFDDAVPALIADMDLMLHKLGVSFGSQWK